MITETDLFKVFLELLGARQEGVRITALVPDAPGELAKLTGAVRDAGGNIIALVTALGESTENRLITLKVDHIDAPTARKVVESVALSIIDLR
jgi:acetoin utilization protein AcuB